MEDILDKAVGVVLGVLALAGAVVLLYVFATSGNTGDYCKNPQTETEMSQCREEAIQSNRYK